MVTRVSGPEPGYVSTPITLVQAAETILEERDKLGTPGVHTTGTVFANTTYISRLQQAGIDSAVIQT